MKKSIISAAALMSVASVAHAADAPAAPAADDSLTIHGITLYGTVDIGLQYQTEGVPINSAYPTGSDDMLGKAANKSVFGLTPNNIQQSKIGVKGSEDLVPGLTGFFKLETYFNPESGQLSNGPASLIQQNGVALANQTASGDSSKAGQAIAIGYVGLSSPTFGDVSIGRQSSLELDDILSYDPMGGSNAFALIGYSGTPAGLGATEDARFDNSLKYAYHFGPARASAMYVFSGSDGEARSAYEFNVGGDYMGFSVDALWGQVRDAVAPSALSAAQVTTLTGLSAAAQATGLPSVNSLAATVSDDTGYSIMAKYDFKVAKVYAGYEHIQYDNPSVKLGGSFNDLGYVVSFPTYTAYTNNKVVQYSWVGAKYYVTPKFEVTGAFYHLYQNSYHAVEGQLDGCSTKAASSCSGTENVFSMMADYHLTKRFDVYAGAAVSTVADGLASGYLKTDTVDPTIGARWNF